MVCNGHEHNRQGEGEAGDYKAVKPFVARHIPYSKAMHNSAEKANSNPHYSGKAIEKEKTLQLPCRAC